MQCANPHNQPIISPKTHNSTLLETSQKPTTNETTMGTTTKIQDQEKPSPILHAAIKATNGIIYVGFRHHNCFNTMLECKVTHIGATQGFIDTNGQFHTREQALKIAQENNQIITKNYPLNKLLSEDLY